MGPAVGVLPHIVAVVLFSSEVEGLLVEAEWACRCVEVQARLECFLPFPRYVGVEVVWQVLVVVLRRGRPLRPVVFKG